MDASVLQSLHEATLRKRELEHLLVFATLDSDQAELKRELKNLNRQIMRQQANISAAYPQEFTDCRDIGHQWSIAARQFDDNGNLLRSLHCPRCDTYRHDLVDDTGELVNRKYSHNSAYLLENAGGAPAKSFWRGLSYLAAKTNI